MTTARTAACVLAVWVLVAADLSDLGSAHAPPASSKPQREFDYFALSLQWLGTICASTRHCCASNGCCRLKPLQTFTIHGLWTDYDDGTWPSCCHHTQFAHGQGDRRQACETNHRSLPLPSCEIARVCACPARLPRRSPAIHAADAPPIPVPEKPAHELC